MNTRSSRLRAPRARTPFAPLAAAALLLLACAAAHAQCPPATLTAGLQGPVKIIQTPLGNLLVAETGTNVANTGRVSVVDQNGNRRTLIEGLPSGINEVGDLSGTTGLYLRGRTLYITNSEGDATLAGPVAGTEVPNPHPSSPIFSSVLALQFSANVERITTGFALTPSDHRALKDGATLTLTDGGGSQATLSLVADFPDYTPDFLPFFPANVRHSNPYGVTAVGDQLYVVDAGANSVRRVDAGSGAVSTLTTFAPIQNPLPFGGPFVEAVPTGIRLYGEQLLVTLFRGFPFPPGAAEVRQVDPSTGQQSALIGGLTSAIDVLPFKGVEGFGFGFLTLELSTNLLGGQPGRLQQFDAAGANPTLIADCLVSPGSMVRDSKTGKLYVAEVFTGRIVVLQVSARNKLVPPGIGKGVLPRD